VVVGEEAQIEGSKGAQNEKDRNDRKKAIRQCVGSSGGIGGGKERPDKLKGREKSPRIGQHRRREKVPDSQVSVQGEKVLKRGGKRATAKTKAVSPRKSRMT